VVGRWWGGGGEEVGRWGGGGEEVGRWEEFLGEQVLSRSISIIHSLVWAAWR
jgi:hypothetical protein